MTNDADSNAEPGPTWDEVRPRLRYVLAPYQAEHPPEGELYDPLSTDSARRLVFGPLRDGRPTGVTERHLEAWGVDRADVGSAAEENMIRLAEASTVTVEDVGGFHRGTLTCPEPWVTGGLALSSAFRGLVEPELEWPVVFVAPAPEVVWIIKFDAKAFLGHLGIDVVQALVASDRPVSAEVFQADDTGIRPIGTFAPRSAAPGPSEDA